MLLVGEPEGERAVGRPRRWGNYRVASQLVASQIVLSPIELAN
jgi:hypothetical protein